MPPGMIMPSSTASSTDSSTTPLSTEGLNMTDVDVQTDFLANLLDDTELQVTSNYYARAFWYGIVAFIALAAALNLLLRLSSRSRYVLSPREGFHIFSSPI